MRAVWIEKVVENFEQFCRDWYDTVWISIRVQIPQAASKQKMCGKTEDILVTWARRYLVTRYDIWLWQDPKLWCCRGRNDKSFCGSNDHHDEQCVLKVLVQSGKKHYCVCVLGTVGKVERGGRRNWSIKIETSPVDSSIHQFIIHRENEILQITPEGFLFVLIKSTHWKYTQSSYCWLKKSFWSSAHLPAWDLSTSILWLLGSSGSQKWLPHHFHRAIFKCFHQIWYEKWLFIAIF